MRKTALTVGMTVAVLVSLWSVLLARSWFDDLNPFASEPYTEIGPSVIHSIRDLSALTTVEVVEYTTIEKGTHGGLLERFRGDRIFLFAVARIGAGVDLAALDEQSFDVDPERRAVRLTIPPPQIQYVALDNEATQVFDRDTGIFTKGDRDLESEARRVADEVLREQALDSGILDRAFENAVLSLTAFLEGLGYEHVEVVQRRPPETESLPAGPASYD